MQIYPSSGCLWSNTAYVHITIPQNTNTSQRYAVLTMKNQCNNTYGRYVGYHGCSGYGSYARAYPNPASTVLNVVYGAEEQAVEQVLLAVSYALLK